MPKTGIEPIFKSYKEFVFPIKLFRLYLFIIFFNYIINIINYLFNLLFYLYLGKELNLHLYIFSIALLPISYQGYEFNWRKIESNYHICNANTTDYHYHISPIFFFNSLYLS